MQLVAERRLRLDDTVDHAPPGAISRGEADPGSAPAEPHERDSRLHAARAMGQRGRSQPARRDPGAAARLVSCTRARSSTGPEARPPTRTRTTSCSAEILERLTGRRVGRAAARAHLRAARPHRHGVRALATVAQRRPDARLRHHRGQATRRLPAPARRALGRRRGGVERTRPGRLLRRAAAREARAARPRRRDAEGRSTLARERARASSSSARRAAAGSTGTRAARRATSPSSPAHAMAAASTSWP